jgi:hypothetical protein
MIEEQIQSTVSMLTSVSIDTVVLVSVVLTFATAGAAAGRAQLLSLILAIYPTAAIVLTRPAWAPIESGWGASVVFGGIYILSFLTIRRFIWTTFPAVRLFKYIELVALSVSGAGSLISTISVTGVLKHVYSLSPNVSWIFESPWSLMLWLLAPLVSLWIVIRR